MPKYTETDMARRSAVAGLAAGLSAASMTSRAQDSRSTAGKGAPSKPSPRLFSFIGGQTGPWTVIRNTPVKGEPWADAARVDVVQGSVPESAGVQWVLRGVTSNLRYVTREELSSLAARQVAPGRPASTRAALIPIKKNTAWWDLPHDERRRIVEENSHHIALGSAYLPAISRRLHHCRDLSEVEPFDFLTWFDYAPSEAKAFEDLVTALRKTEEWKYVEREVDIRLER
jgi:hypothetical protein